MTLSSILRALFLFSATASIASGMSSSHCEGDGSCATEDAASLIQSRLSVEDIKMHDQAEASSGEAARGGACCVGKCASSADCGTNLFCCPFHRMCMDRSTASTVGPNCDSCKKSPSPPPPVTPPTKIPDGGLLCGFEDRSKPYCGLWEDAKTGDQRDWSRRSGRTPSGGTGPNSAVEGKHYLYFETSNPVRKGNKAILQSNQKVNLGSGAYLEFDFHMLGSGIGSFRVEVDNSKVWEMKGNKGNKWQAASIKLDQFAGQSVNIKFVAVRGKSWKGDIALDDVMMFPGSGGSSNTPTPAPTPAPTGAGNDQQGLTAEFYYFGQGCSMPGRNGRKPAVVRVDTQVNYRSTGSAWQGLSHRDNFYAEWSGYLLISAAGQYTFATESDDGSMLSVDGKRLVNNDGCHGMRKRDGRASLSAGRHSILITFFEKGGGAGMIAKYSGPDTNNQLVVLPSDKLYVGLGGTGTTHPPTAVATPAPNRAAPTPAPTPAASPAPTPAPGDQKIKTLVDKIAKLEGQMEEFLKLLKQLTR